MENQVYVGRMRSGVTHALLTIATLGIYFLIWHYLLGHEVRKHRGHGLHPIVTLLIFLLLPVLGWFLAPLLTGLSVRKLQREVDAHKRTNPLYAAFWGLFPILGWAFAGGLLQAGANRVWDRLHHALDRAASGPATVECPQCTHRLEMFLHPFAPNPVTCPNCGRVGEV